MKTVRVQVICKSCGGYILTQRRKQSTHCTHCGHYQYVPENQQWEGVVPEQMREAIRRTPVELVCNRCDREWHSRAAGGNVVKCPGCKHPRRVPTAARATDDPAWQREVALAARHEADAADPGSLPPPPSDGRYGEAERAAAASVRRPRGRRRGGAGRAPRAYVGPDGSTYDEVPERRAPVEPCQTIVTRFRPDDGSPYSDYCGKRHRHETMHDAAPEIDPEIERDIKREERATARAERRAAQSEEEQYLERLRANALAVGDIIASIRGGRTVERPAELSPLRENDNGGYSRTKVRDIPAEWR